MSEWDSLNYNKQLIMETAQQFLKMELHNIDRISKSQSILTLDQLHAISWQLIAIITELKPVALY